MRCAHRRRAVMKRAHAPIGAQAPAGDAPGARRACRIPQETRLLFRGLSKLEKRARRGPAQSGDQILARGLPPNGRGWFGPMPRDWQLNRLGRVVISLEQPTRVSRPTGRRSASASTLKKHYYTVHGFYIRRAAAKHWRADSMHAISGTTSGAVLRAHAAGPQTRSGHACGVSDGAHSLGRPCISGPVHRHFGPPLYRGSTAGRPSKLMICSRVSHVSRHPDGAGTRAGRSAG